MPKGYGQFDGLGPAAISGDVKSEEEWRYYSCHCTPDRPYRSPALKEVREDRRQKRGAGVTAVDAYRMCASAENDGGSYIRTYERTSNLELSTAGVQIVFTLYSIHIEQSLFSLPPPLDTYETRVTSSA